jgi:hypothetical protein
MTDYIRPLLRMFIFFALVFTVAVLAKPTHASAIAMMPTCCQNCENILANCDSRCTTGACRLSCSREFSLCSGTCNGGCPQ